MTEYEEIKSGLAPTFEKFGLIMEQEEFHPNAFGSAYSVFSGSGLKYRVVWDGKDGCGYVQIFENNDWVDLNANAPESEGPEFKNAVLRMRISLSEHIALAKLNA